jgi:hypothetical protein
VWGLADGSGAPIEFSLAEYLDRVAYGYDFARADMVGLNQVLGCGTTINNVFEAFPGSIVVEYHFPGFHPRFEAFDWQSLRLVFQQVDGAWHLVALLNDHWTT